MSELNTKYLRKGIGWPIDPQNRIRRVYFEEWNSFYIPFIARKVRDKKWYVYVPDKWLPSEKSFETELDAKTYYYLIK